MKYDILSPDVLGTVSPADVMTYLSETGWNLRRRTETTSVYRKELPIAWDEVTVPNSNVYSDYPQLISLVLETLSKVESRSEQEVAMDILSGNTNETFQYRLMIGDRSGTVPLDWMVQILQAHRKMSSAAYLDIVDPKPYYNNMVRANRALKDMKVGQTSYGSYVMTIVYPSHIADPGSEGGSAVSDDAMKHIVDKILSSSRTIVESAADGTAIEEGSGISYNFIDSFMSLRSEEGHSFELRGSGPCSNNHPPLNVPDSIFPRIGDLADGLRPRSADGIRTFSGRLYSVQEIDYDGQVSKFKLEYFDEGGPAKASVTLDGHDRGIAMESLIDHALVSFEGRLSGYGNAKTIGDVSKFHIVR